MVYPRSAVKQHNQEDLHNEGEEIEKRVVERHSLQLMFILSTGIFLCVPQFIHIIFLINAKHL